MSSSTSLPEWTEGDTARPLTGTCTSKAAGTSTALPVDLTNATALLVVITFSNGRVVSNAATKTDAPNGKWTMAWKAGDLKEGHADVAVRVTWADNSIETFPAAKPSIYCRPPLGA